MAAVVVAYRLRRRGPDGRELPVLQVEMRGRKLQGMIADGDLIQAPEPLPAGGFVQLETVTNVTTGAPVVLKREDLSPGCRIAFLCVVGLVALLLIVVFLRVALDFG